MDVVANARLNCKKEIEILNFYLHCRVLGGVGEGKSRIVFNYSPCVRVFICVLLQASRSRHSVQLL